MSKLYRVIATAEDQTLLVSSQEFADRKGAREFISLRSNSLRNDIELRAGIPEEMIHLDVAPVIDLSEDGNLSGLE